MRFPWTIRRKVETPSDQKLVELIALLFPPFELRSEMQENGKLLKYHIDRSVDTNLDAALVDLQNGNNDQVAQKTINSVVSRLAKARQILGAYSDFDKDAKYIIVDDHDDSTLNPESILPDEF